MDANRKTFWTRRIDALRETMGLESDAALADYLKVRPQMIGQIRAGTRRPSPKLAAMIIDRSGYGMTVELALAMLPDSVAETLRQATQRQARRIAGK